ncbi:MAG: homocysteine S-methyltransferase family protein [Myxococcales bacterium]|nr:homocysteine S-methyltransferase family protein [Myxococcales bacterium]
MTRVRERVLVLDGALGSELARAGVPTPAPLWSAWALLHRPDAVLRLHRAYAEAGADVHTTDTFRTTRRALRAALARARARGRDDPAVRRALARYPELVSDAVGLAREGARSVTRPRQRVAGSLAPLEDCYHPERSPRHARVEHRAMARALARAGADLILCETFPHVGEAVVAVEEAVATGLETWVSWSPGPRARLLTPLEVGRGAERAARAGASVCLVNCLPPEASLPYLAALRAVGVPFGIYANVMGRAALSPRRYGAWAARWLDAGASVVGGCCGAGPAHVRAVREVVG